MTKDLWDKLGTLYQSKSLVNKLFLWKTLCNLRMKDGDSVTEHMNAFNTMVKTTSDEGRDVYLASSSTRVDHETWLIDSGASFHFTPHREWFYEYEKCDGSDVFLGDDRKDRIVGHGIVKLKLQGGGVRTLLGVLHIPALAKNLIFVSKLDDAGVKTVFKNDTYKMVWGELGYKLWNPATRKVVYNRDVVFREVKDVIKHEVQPKEPEKIEFELKEEESDYTTEEESEDEEPQNSGEVVDSKDGKLWKEAIVDEMVSLHKNEAWDLAAGRKPIGNKWVFKKKKNAKGKVEKYKARLVEKGYSQVPGIDFGDIFSPVAKVTSIILLLSVVAAFDFEVEQMDVKTTCLHRDLEEEIYMK
eukprot:PITA_04037